MEWGWEWLAYFLSNWKFPEALEYMVDVTGIEPVTPCLQSRCSPS
jgi:hypothetical protein